MGGEEVVIPTQEEEPKTFEKCSSFKEESNFLSDFKEFERKALNDLKSRLDEVILETSVMYTVVLEQLWFWNLILKLSLLRRLRLGFGNEKPSLVGYTDVDMAGDVDTPTEAFKELLWMKRSKHIDVRYHWIRDAINDKLFELEKIHTDHNGSDMLTKALPREKLEACSSVTIPANPST
ncbi:hypothetical protein EZV62_002733 [Acer yangbiense]|uniref:Reverse transcriptase Ty1/copia-type domain-containing protein n=1 Tax=Acer yangbiense TaxID=1000413 RepID=A0A5C7IZ34_9ROSI|nr:hypothetical protein EZV62_002733 [Acer yangbiense]